MPSPYLPLVAAISGSRRCRSLSNSRHDITLETARKVGWEGERLKIGAGAKAAMKSARAGFERLMANPDIVIYGVTSGYGQNARHRLDAEQRKSHARQPLVARAGTFRRRLSGTCDPADGVGAARQFSRRPRGGATATCRSRRGDAGADRYRRSPTRERYAPARSCRSPTCSAASRWQSSRRKRRFSPSRTVPRSPPRWSPTAPSPPHGASILQSGCWRWRPRPT